MNSETNEAWKRLALFDPAPLFTLRKVPPHFTRMFAAMLPRLNAHLLGLHKVRRQVKGRKHARLGQLQHLLLLFAAHLGFGTRAAVHDLQAATRARL
jgi:hypothetical protein